VGSRKKSISDLNFISFKFCCAKSFSFLFARKTQRIKSGENMPSYKYLIVGGGMTADAAVRGIRQVDQNGAIGLISAEPHRPYNRPPLSKGLWQGTKLESIWRKTDSQGVELHLGRKAQTLDSQNKSVIDDQGTVYTFDKLLLATGGTPARLPFGDDHIIYFRTLQDYERLRTLAGQVERFAVIGGGFIGSEIAAALTLNGKKVTLIFPQEGIGGNIFPRELSLLLNDFYQQKGVELLPGEFVAGLESGKDHITLKTRSSKAIPADGVVAGIGITPNVDLAKAAGLEVGNGIGVDEFLRTKHPDVYAAGDVAAFYNPALEKRVRVEHEDNANTMGLMAGQAMAGEPSAYHHLPFFYSDLFELGYEAVGELDSRMEIISDWKEPYREGVVYYLREGRVRGVLLWNVWGQVEAARRLIAEPGPFHPEDIKGRLPENH
jgi:NADPH-dependent 2,4-dienoyl-CoA reductase/sulfur reductase-like enzyme